MRSFQVVIAITCEKHPSPLGIPQQRALSQAHCHRQREGQWGKNLLIAVALVN